MIYAELSGGLGNQMFVYAFARAMGLCCQEPVTLIDRQDWKTGSPAHTALALQALHISSEVQFITDAGFVKQHLPVQNAAKALMIRHEQRVGLMDRDWHPFEARMAPMLNAIGLHFATEGFTPAKRGHAKNFLAWGYFQGADYFKDQAETIRAELLPIENPEHGFTAAAAAYYEQKEQAFTSPVMREVERVVLLRVVDEYWMDHIDAMTDLRQGIGLRAYAQTDPIIAYKKESLEMFEEMIDAMKEETVRRLHPKKQVAGVLISLLVLAGLILCTAYLVDGSFNPFLYFRF